VGKWRVLLTTTVNRRCAQRINERESARYRWPVREWKRVVALLSDLHIGGRLRTIAFAELDACLGYDANRQRCR
jgi:hypothetical protein